MNSTEHTPHSADGQPGGDRPGAGEHLSPLTLRRYLGGELTPRQMHTVERHCLTCSLCAQALEGFSSRLNLNGRNPDFLGKDLVELKKRLNGRLQRDKRVKPLWQPWTVAATFLLLMLASVYFVTMKVGQKQAEDRDVVIQLPTNPDTLIIYQKPAIVLAHNTRQIEPPHLVATEQGRIYPESRRMANSLLSPPKSAKNTHTERMARSDQENPLLLPPATSEAPAAEEEKMVPASGKSKKPSTSEAIAGRVNGLSVKKNENTSTSNLPMGPFASQSDSAVAGQSVVRGIVRAAEDGTVLPGVNVFIKGTKIATSTDSNGIFSLSAPAGSTLVFAFVGLENQEVPVDSPAAMEVKMHADVKSLSEEVVVGEKRIKHMAPQPEGGFKALDLYLDNHLQYPEKAREMQVKGTVGLEFTVEPDGTLSDIQVSRSLGFGCDEEAVRVLLNGPKWKPAVENNRPVRKRAKTAVTFGK